ncbi:MAG: FHA domain-containing protein [Myxococcota bacterium]
MTLTAAITTALLFYAVTSPHAALAATETQAVDVVFVLDNSGSMRQNDPQYLTRVAVSNFARALAEAPDVDGRMGVVLFDGNARLIQKLSPVSTAEVDGILSGAMNALDFSGQRTNSPAGIERALYELRENGREAGRRAIIFLSDGKIDTGDAQTDYDASWWLRDELADESRSLGIRIFSVAFTDAADYQLMQAIAQKTRASYYRAYEASELTTVVSDVLNKVAEEDFYALASATAGSPASASGLTPFPSSESSGGSGSRGPDVAAAPTAASLDIDSPAGLLAWMPVAVLLVAATLLWRRRTPPQTVDALIAQAELDMDAPAAQLLDFGGQLGETGTTLALKRGRNRIGRDKHNDIILDDDAISSEHAVIEVHDGRYWIEDRRSTNGTRIGDERIAPEQRVPLKGGDHIRFAEIDLMFVLAGYVPGGATVFLDSSTTPPIGWREESEPRPESKPNQKPRQKLAAEPKPDSKNADIAIAAERERTNPAFVENLDAELSAPASAEPAVPDERRAQISLLPDSVDSSEPTAPPLESNAAVEEVAEAEVPADPYRECLDFHLARVEEISPAFDQFVSEAFDPEIRDALAVSARELIAEAMAAGPGALRHKEYTASGIRYIISGIAGEMDAAQGAYVESFGGFTRMLTEQLQSESFRRDRCEILAVLSFGEGQQPWVSLSIVPDEGQDPRIDLLSYEFLTAEERGEIEPTESPEEEASQTSLA